MDLFVRGVRGVRAHVSVYGVASKQLRHKNMMRVAHSYRKKVTRKSTLEYKLTITLTLLKHSNTNARTQVREKDQTIRDRVAVPETQPVCGIERGTTFEITREEI